MSLAVLRSRALAGMEALAVSVEVHLANELPSLTIDSGPETDRFQTGQTFGCRLPAPILRFARGRPVTYKVDTSSGRTSLEFNSATDKGK